VFDVVEDFYGILMYLLHRHISPYLSLVTFEMLCTCYTDRYLVEDSYGIRMLIC